jgi:hypothetical protein
VISIFDPLVMRHKIVFNWRIARSLVVVLICAWCSGVDCSAVRAEQHVVVVLDDSGSMADRMRGNRRMEKMAAAKSALLTVLEQLPATARVGVVLLNGTRQGDPWVVPLGPVDLRRARKTIRPIRAEGGTPLGQFIKIGADALLRARDKFHYGDYRLLVVTDGEASDPELVAMYLPDVLSRGLTVDVIGVDMPGNHSLATQVHSYRKADDAASLTRAVREVFAETASDATDTGESDFALLEGIPAETAAAALQALGEAGNEPIGANRARRESTNWNTPASTPQDSFRRSARWLILMALVVIFFLVQITKAVVRSKRRHRW